MPKVKTSELTGAALDWAVAKCEGITPTVVKKKYSDGHFLYSLPASTIPLEYSTNWAQGGPIIERGCIDVMFEGPEWYAYMRWEDKTLQYDGPTPLIAAMRCYVASKLGGEIDVPEELK